VKLYALRRSKNTASNACGVFAFAAHSDVDAAFLADGMYLLQGNRPLKSESFFKYEQISFSY